LISGYLLTPSACGSPLLIGGVSLKGVYDLIRPGAAHSAASGATEFLSQSESGMPHAIIRGKNGRQHEVDFGDAPVRVEIYSTEETVEIFIEADFETLPEERRRFAILNISRHQFSEATGAASRRAAKPRNPRHAELTRG
jgi:hypothetical protein